MNDTCRIVGWVTRYDLALAYVCFLGGTVTVNLRVNGHPVFNCSCSDSCSSSCSLPYFLPLPPSFLCPFPPSLLPSPLPSLPSNLPVPTPQSSSAYPPCTSLYSHDTQIIGKSNLHVLYAWSAHNKSFTFYISNADTIIKCCSILTSEGTQDLILKRLQQQNHATVVRDLIPN